MIPKSIEIRFEPTTKCNYNCQLCLHKKLNRKHQTMSFDMFKFLLDKIISETRQHEVCAFAGIGEPLLDKDFIKKISYAKKKGLKPIFVTNGSLLTPNKFKQLESAGLHSVRVSFHGGSPEDYVSLHRVSEDMYFKVKNNLFKIAKIKKTAKLLLTYAVVKGVNDKSIWEWKRLWRDKADLMEVWRVHNWVSAFKYRTLQNERRKTCGRLSKGPLQVQVDGTVNACCFDYDGNLVFGDLKTQSLREIFFSKEYKSIAKCHKTGKFKNSGLICENCDQRNFKKDDALIYSSKYSKINERVNMTSTSYEAMK